MTETMLRTKNSKILEEAAREYIEENGDNTTLGDMCKDLNVAPEQYLWFADFKKNGVTRNIQMFSNSSMRGIVKDTLDVCRQEIGG